MPQKFARTNRSRGNKCGESQWHRDHWKAVDATKGANKRGKATITIRWQEDEKYRNSQVARGWAEEYCRYLDYLRTIDICCVGTWEQAQKGTITMACNTKYRLE